MAAFRFIRTSTSLALVVRIIITQYNTGWVIVCPPRSTNQRTARIDEFENNPQTEDIPVDCLFAYEQLVGAMQSLEWARDIYFDELELDATLKIDAAVVTLRHSLNWDRLWMLNTRATPTPDDDAL